jgi:hypothetical protein
LNRAVDAVAGLTAVDGATLMTSSYEVLAFGAKIVRRRGQPVVEQMTVTEPVEGNAPMVINPTTFGGTRHLSAAQLVYDQARLGCARRGPGRPLYRLRLVAVHRDGARSSHRDVVAVEFPLKTRAFPEP